MESITFSMVQLRAALLCAAKQDIRYYLNGVYIESAPGSTRMVATTGHYLLAVDYDHGDTATQWTGNFVLPRDVCEMIAKLKAPYDVGIIEIEDVGTAEVDPAWSTLRKIHVIGTISYYGTRIGFKSVEGVFPDYKRVISSWVGTHEDMKAGQYNPEYIGTFSKVAKVFGSKGGSFNLWQRGEDSALVQFSPLPERINAIGVLMPMKTFTRGTSQGTPLTSKFQSNLPVPEVAQVDSAQSENHGA